MWYFFRYNYCYGYEPRKYLCNPVRIVETVLCLICLVLAILMIMKYPMLTVGFITTICGVAGAFLIITFIDCIAHILRKPIYWNSWAMFALLGALLFFICLGLLIDLAINSAKTLVIVALLFYAVTAILFLLDALFLLYYIRQQGVEIWPDVDKTEDYDICGKEQEPERYIREDDVCWCKPDEVCRHHKYRTSTSYGGTFPMSKEGAPLPSPDSVTNTPTVRPPVKKSTSMKIAPSQSVIQGSSGKLRKDKEGNVYLDDGTPLTEVKLEKGAKGYEDPYGNLYTKKGMPIAPPTNASSKVRKDSKGQPFLDNGTSLTEVQLEKGETGYRDEEGNLYNKYGKKIPKDKVKCEMAEICEDECPAECADTSPKKQGKGGHKGKVKCEMAEVCEEDCPADCAEKSPKKSPRSGRKSGTHSPKRLSPSKSPRKQSSASAT